MTATTTPAPPSVVTALDEAHAFLDAARQIGDTSDHIAHYNFPGRMVPLTMTTLRALVDAAQGNTRRVLTDTADALDAMSCDGVDVALWLRARAHGCTCGNPQACSACGAVLCPDCQVGEVSRCDHQIGVLCVGCDIEACAGCAQELRREQTPFAGMFR